jgi:4-amino-4-deoxy-L-arabinose transferase-like glycosyltransferase
MKKPIRWISIILAIAICLRLLGIWHDYPYSFYPDEAHFVKRALSFGSLDFNPHWFHKPAFYMYILFFEYGLFFIFGKIIGLWNSVSDFATAYIINPGPFYIIGRTTTAAFGVATIYITYLIGEKHFKKNVGLFASLLLTLSYAHVSCSQDIKADIPASFFAVLSAYFMLNYLKDGQRKQILLAAAFAGIGTATKTYPEIMLIPILAAILVTPKTSRNLPNRLKQVFVSTFAAFSIFSLFYFLCSPYSFLDPLGRRAVFHDVITFYHKVTSLWGESPHAERPVNFISHRTSLVQGFVQYGRVLLDNTGMGLPISLVSISGVLFLLIRKNYKYLIFLLFPILFACLSIYTAPGYANTRHQQPIFPFLTIAGGALICFIVDSFPSKQRIMYCLLYICLCWPLFSIIHRGIHISKTDTRNIASQWVEKNIPAGAKLVIDENGPQLLKNEQSLQSEILKAAQADQQGQFTAHYDTYLEYQLQAAEQAISYDISEIRRPWWRKQEVQEGRYELSSDYDKDMGNPIRPVGVNSYAHYVHDGYKYAIVHSFAYDSYFKPDSKKAKNFPSFKKFYSDLFEHGKLVHEFSPLSDNRPGPLVQIFQLTHGDHHFLKKINPSRR